MASAATKQAEASMTYAQAGVDIDAGDAVVKLIKPMLRRTHGTKTAGVRRSSKPQRRFH